jgi:hypothetical protein
MGPSAAARRVSLLSINHGGLDLEDDFLSAIRERAQEGIARRLFSEASQTDAELRDLGRDIASQCGSIPAFGPIKTRGRAAEKVKADRDTSLERPAGRDSGERPRGHIGPDDRNTVLRNGRPHQVL